MMKKIIQKFIIRYVYIPLLRLNTYIEINKIKKIKKISDYVYIALTYRIRNINAFKIKGVNKKNDEIVFFIVSSILKLKFNEDDKKRLKELKSSLNSVFEKVNNDATVKSLITIDAHISKYLAVKSHNYNGEFDDLISSSKNFKFDSHLKNLNKLIAKIKKISKPEIREVLDRSTIKLKFSVTYLLSIIGLVTPLIFLGSYFSCKIYYGYFNINLNNFFSIQDYVSNGILDIELAFKSIFFSLVGFLWGIYDQTRYVSNNHRIFDKNHKVLEVTFLLIIISSIISAFYFDLHHKFQLLELLIIVLVFIASDFIAKRFFTNQLKAKFFFIIVFLFFASIFSTSYEKIDEIKKNISNGNKNYKIFYKEKRELDNLYIIGFNSRYIFLVDSLMIKTTIINRDGINKIELNKGIYEEN